jgi:hypothetical protein
MAVGLILAPRQAEAILRDGKADLGVPIRDMVVLYEIRRRRRPFRIRGCVGTPPAEILKEEPDLTRKTPKKGAIKAAAPEEPTLLSRILSSLDDDKAEDIVTIDLEGRSALAMTSSSLRAGARPATLRRLRSI